MGNLIDASGQWLIGLPLVSQLIVLVVVLFLFGGFAAYVLIGVIDIVNGFIVRWLHRLKTGQQTRGKGKKSG